jgi:hypothetical protein
MSAVNCDIVLEGLVDLLMPHTEGQRSEWRFTVSPTSPDHCLGTQKTGDGFTARPKYNDDENMWIEADKDAYVGEDWWGETIKLHAHEGEFVQGHM